MKHLPKFQPQFVTDTFFSHVPSDQINLGQCFIWAYFTYLLFEDVKLCDTDSHAFIKYRGKYYDSDRPNGVDSWLSLPASGFSSDKSYSSMNANDFKRVWQHETIRFQTSWDEIELAAERVIRKLTKSHGKSSQDVGVSG